MNKKRFALTALLVVAASCIIYATTEKPDKSKIPTFPANDFAKAKAYPVVRVIDGNTIVISRNDKNVTVRLIGVDTPKTVKPGSSMQAYGKEASRFLTNLLKGENVYLIIDKQQGDKDRHKRTLAYLYRAPGGLFVNAEIIRQGYCHAYVKNPFKYMKQFQQLERFAKFAKKGLWEPAATVKPTPTVTPVLAPVVNPKLQPDPADVTVFITRTGRQYHRGDCKLLLKNRIAIKLKDAKRRGYTPCKACRPPN